CYRVTCRDNLVIDHPYSNGIWYDVGNVDGCFINNWVEGVGTIDEAISPTQPWPSSNGFFFEISKGAVCAGNVFVNCDHGLWALNSSDVLIYQNTFINSMACLGRTSRSAAGDHFGWHPSTGPDVDERDGHAFVNNLLVGDENFQRPLLFVWQPASLCERVTNSQLKELDHNVYARGSTKGSDPLILWSPATNENCQLQCQSLEDFQHQQPEFEKQSLYFADYAGPLFKCSELGNYQLLQSFPGAKNAGPLPKEIGELLRSKGCVGAFPPAQ
ncbi:right-handed parallel beta-helix repeat-containing protein, partial [candidate division KSB1 bacterium]|nr:right-handed parallel beta-helix repeat-containing protein [candidate division KSB1 bacterium]